MIGTLHNSSCTKYAFGKLRHIHDGQGQNDQLEPVFIVFYRRDSLPGPNGAFLSLLSRPLALFEFLTALQSINNKMGKLTSSLAAAVRSQAAPSHSQWMSLVTVSVSGSRVVCTLPTLQSHGSLRAHPAPEPQVTLCTPCSSTT